MNRNRFRMRGWPTATAVLLLVAVLAACASPGSSSTIAPATAATSTAAPAATATTPAPEATGGRLIGFLQLLRAGCDFCAEVEKNIKTVFEANGDEVFVLDNEFDVDKTVSNVDTMISRGVDVLLCFCPPGSVDAALNKVRAAGIPYIGIDGVPQDTGSDWNYFGANGDDSGKKSGQWVVDYANANWGGQIDAVLSTWIPEWEPASMGRLTAFESVLTEFDPKITHDTITLVDAKLEYEKVQLAVEAFLNANPDKNHLVVYAPTSDVHGLAGLAAAQNLGREGDVVVVSHGADAQVRGELAKCEIPLKASLAYFPDRYGEFLLPIVNAVLSGEPHEQLNFVDHQVVDCNNLKDFYPNG